MRYRDLLEQRLRRSETLSLAGAHIESTSSSQHDSSDRKNTYPGDGHAQAFSVPSQSSSSARGNGTAVPEAVVAIHFHEYFLVVTRFSRLD